MTSFTLDKDTVHIWKFKWLELGDNLTKTLSPEEKEQAKKYKIPDDKSRYCTGRAMMRHLSGKYLQTKPKDLQITTNDHGKPYLSDFNDQLSFNISHSGDWILLAFTSGRSVGIDVENTQKSASFNPTNVAKHSFNEAEQNFLTDLPEAEQQSTFHDIWACKEAVIKALGTGLHGGLANFSVIPIPTEGEWSGIANTIVRKLKIDKNHVGAISIQGKEPISKIKLYGLADSEWQ